MTSPADFRHYLTVTGNYWAFTLTDGAIRMLVVLHFHALGYSPLQIALLFLFYEFFGVVTNLLGGWLGSHMGLNRTMQAGTALQVMALLMLTVDAALLTVPYVMVAQALSGIAKDLNKMSAKASVKLLLPRGDGGRLFKWVAVLTGSKNTLKGMGFFLGGALLAGVGFRGALGLLAGMLVISLLLTLVLLPRDLGTATTRVKFRHLFAKQPAINRLSAARFFLFGARDLWFVVGLPVFLSSGLGWSHGAVGAFLALWVIGYGLVQASAPVLLRHLHHEQGPDGRTALGAIAGLAVVTAGIAGGFAQQWPPATTLVVGLGVFGVVFALNSAIHSYLILAYTSAEQAAVDVGFYYMANAAGRLAGTVLSGWVFQSHGLAGCLWWSLGFVLAAAMITLVLPRDRRT